MATRCYAVRSRVTVEVGSVTVGVTVTDDTLLYFPMRYSRLFGSNTGLGYSGS